MAENSLSKFHSFDNHHFFSIKTPNHEKHPRVCVICVASYHLDVLYGIWIDVTQDIEIIYGKINDMLSKSPASSDSNEPSEWAIYAYEGFESIPLNEDEDIEQIHYKAIFLSTYGKWSSKLLEYYDDDLDLAEEAMASFYQGKFSSKLEFAKNLFNRKVKFQFQSL